MEFTVEENADEDVLKFENPKYPSLKRTFRFKRVFLPDSSTQADVFEKVAKPIIENVLNGYNGTIFAYGQTGTGKTYTMTGDFSNPTTIGIIPRAIEFLFQYVGDKSNVSISYFEIYNEHGYDLIGYQPTPSTVELQQVNVLEDSKGNLHFRNLSAHYVKTTDEALDLLLFGDGNRMVAETLHNLRSSRSHTIFLITLESTIPERDSLRRSTLHLVDLAGSERLGKASHTSNNTLESRYINLSLHYLEQVLVALGEPGRIHVPYRNSLMTTVLKNSLGGNCCTSMIATFSCEPKDFEETLQTCRFSQRVAMIRTEAKINEIFDSNKEMELLKRENAFLKEQIRELKSQKHPESTEELSDDDKEECMEKIREYIADSELVVLPPIGTRKAEYCFMLLRNEILKLKAEKRLPGPIDGYKRLNGGQAKISPHLAKQSKADSSELKYNRSYRRKSETVVRKRRVVMDLPKINVIYKKYKTRELVSREVISPNNFDDVEKRQNETNHSENTSPPSRTKRVFQTQSSGVKVIFRDELKHLPAESSQTNNKQEAVITQDKAEDHQSLDQNGSRKSRISFNETHVDVGVQYEEISSPNDVNFTAEESPSSEESIGSLGQLIKKVSQESDGPIRFSVTDLPLTGDAEIDEEIIRFYKARYQKFKTRSNQS